MASSKVIGRILSLGFPLPGTQVDNYNFLSAPAFFDYDAIVVDPHALSSLIESMCAGETEATTYGDVPVRNAAATPTTGSLADILHQRRAEVVRLLENGGAIICFAHPAARHDGVIGADPFDDYYWLPDSLAAVCRAPVLVPGDGTQAHVVDYAHPLGAFLVGQLANVAYRAHFDVVTLPTARVFARSQGGAAIGVEPTAESGRLVLLPALRGVPAGDARYAMSDALQAGIRRALGATAAGREPAWLPLHPLPGLDERAAVLAEAEQASADAQTGLADASATYDELARYRALLWQEGSVGLNEVVLDALRYLGFDVYAQDPNAIEIHSGDAAALVEIEGSEYPIDLAPHYRLRQRIEQAIERRGIAPRGLIVVNGCRLSDPAGREREVSEALLLAAETMRYAIAPASGLYGAVASQLSGDHDAVTTYKQRLISEDGLLRTMSRA